MTWNYRIIEFAEHRGLHEVYYDPKGRPEGYTENAISFVESLDEAAGITGGLELALRDARELPILSASVFDLPKTRRPICPRRAIAMETRRADTGNTDSVAKP